MESNYGFINLFEGVTMRFFYYTRTGRIGPVDVEEIQPLINAGEVLPDTTLENERGAQARADSFAALKFPMAGAAVPPPVQPPVVPLSDADLMARVKELYPAAYARKKMLGVRTSVTISLFGLTWFMWCQWVSEYCADSYFGPDYFMGYVVNGSITGAIFIYCCFAYLRTQHTEAAEAIAQAKRDILNREK